MARLYANARSGGPRAAPHPPMGVAPGESTRGDALVLPCASLGDTARHTALSGAERRQVHPAASPHRRFSDIARPAKINVIAARPARISHSFTLKYLNGKANGLNPDHRDFPRRLVVISDEDVAASKPRNSGEHEQEQLEPRHSGEEPDELQKSPAAAAG